MAEEEIEWVEEYARELVRAGFSDRDEIVGLIGKYIEGEDYADQVSPAELADREIAALLEEQKSWPEVTDFDRLEQVFQELYEKGVLPRHDFTCCAQCGSAEMVDEIEDEAAKGKAPKGYVFYHQQDTTSALEGDGLLFFFGATDMDASESDYVAVGQILASALREEGFEVTWDNTSGARVEINMDWKRRWGDKSEFVQKRPFVSRH
ncbi:hypothetical protein [Nitratireductor sp. XY-223]|uniref:DUF6891 domain-containing protein n=1 Tax=Nitratireductor sp. XY-223 TaxID=2561926 RepID=UPI0010A9CD59|nr:hypothetical protein [Nitratireductor sp. XY-223]